MNNLKVSTLFNDKGNPVANHHIIRYTVGNTHCVQFLSYSSIVFMDEGAMVFGRDWDYSRTTLKHTLEFLRHFYMPQTLYRTFGTSTPCTADIRKAIANGVVYYDESMR